MLSILFPHSLPWLATDDESVMISQLPLRNIQVFSTTNNDLAHFSHFIHFVALLAIELNQKIWIITSISTLAPTVPVTSSLIFPLLLPNVH